MLEEERREHFVASPLSPSHSAQKEFVSLEENLKLFKRMANGELTNYNWLSQNQRDVLQRILNESAKKLAEEREKPFISQMPRPSFEQNEALVEDQPLNGEQEEILMNTIKQLSLKLQTFEKDRR
ncbi:MAG: hypothetical protein JSS34_05295 [Proteobacteria bacterium]|nr:hypothetical protein [Pseudomonadota bacterium]